VRVTVVALSDPLPTSPMLAEVEQCTAALCLKLVELEGLECFQTNPIEVDHGSVLGLLRRIRLQLFGC
jgi:hypothetical protein